MRADLQALLETMLDRSAKEAGVSIDAVGEALSACGVAATEVEDWMTRYEDAGGVLRSPSGGGGTERLKLVLASARALAGTLGRKPTMSEIAADTRLDVAHVRWALALGRTLGH